MTVISAILSIIKAIPTVDSWFQQLMAAYVLQQQAETLSAISDAAALAARATTDEERFAAALAWKNALSRPRVTA